MRAPGVSASRSRSIHPILGAVALLVGYVALAAGSTLVLSVVMLLYGIWVYGRYRAEMAAELAVDDR